MQLKNILKISAVTTALVLAGCGGSDDKAPTPTPTASPVVDQNAAMEAALTTTITDALNYEVVVRVLEGKITEDTTLAAMIDNKPAFYAIKGGLEVGNGGVRADNGPTLTIEPGAVLFGQRGADYLVVHRDAKIEAVGTQDKPIVFTSVQDVSGLETTPGQWGGVVILGNAPTNKCPDDGTSCALQVEGAASGSVFGGTDWADNSGELKYVVVKYAGFAVDTDNELNGITFGGVGSGTMVDYIQVHANEDDGVEFFGGAVNVKHLVLTGNRDDSIDWDNGYKGMMQHVYVAHNTDDGQAHRAIEADNDGKAPNKTPMSEPTIANMTIIGNNWKIDGDSSEGIYLREGTAAKIFNTVVTGPENMGECLELEGGKTDSVTVTNATSGKIVIENTIMACNNGENFKDSKANYDTADKSDDTLLLDLKEWFDAQSGNSENTDIMISVNGVPQAGSILIADGAGQDVSNTQNGFFDSVNYIGAFDGTTDWRQGWAYGFGGADVAVQP